VSPTRRSVAWFGTGRGVLSRCVYSSPPTSFCPVPVFASYVGQLAVGGGDVALRARDGGCGVRGLLVEVGRC
jgi:hypothetical protein